MRLLGYYLAEGSGVSDHQSRFTFNTKEIDYINDVSILLKNIFNINPNKEVIIGNSTSVAISSRLLREFFINLTGKEATIKKLPEWVLYLPLEKQKELINGYWRGDGHKSKYGFEFATSSYILAKQVKMILTRFGFLPCFRINKSKKRKNPKYTIEVYGEKIKDFCDIVGEHHEILDKRIKTYNCGWNDGTFLFIPIRSIEPLSIEYFK